MNIDIVLYLLIVMMFVVGAGGFRSLENRIDKLEKKIKALTKKG